MPISSWRQILEGIDELEDFRLYDEAKREPSDPIPFGQVLSELTQRMSDLDTSSRFNVGFRIFKQPPRQPCPDVADWDHRVEESGLGALIEVPATGHFQGMTRYGKTIQRNH